MQNLCDASKSDRRDSEADRKALGRTLAQVSAERLPRTAHRGLPKAERQARPLPRLAHPEHVAIPLPLLRKHVKIFWFPDKHEAVSVNKENLK